MTYVQSFSEVLYLCPENCLRNRSRHLQFISVQRILPGPHVKWLSLLQLFRDRIGANGRGAHTEETPRTAKGTIWQRYDLSANNLLDSHASTSPSLLGPRFRVFTFDLCGEESLKPVFSKSIYEKQFFSFHYLFSFFLFFH